MTTPMPASPFLSASDGLHPLSSVAVASGIPYKPQGAAAEILSSPGVLPGSLPSGEIEPSVMLACMPGGPVDVTSTSPEAKSAGTNSAWVRDCDRIELQEIQSSPDVLLNLSEIEPSATLVFASGETPAVIIPSRGTVAADRIDDISEIFTFARGLMRDYQPDFQELLNEIAPFPMEYLPDYRLGDDDQPLFLQGAVA